MAVCCFYLQGQCRFGAKCRFAHTFKPGCAVECHFGDRCKAGHAGGPAQTALNDAAAEQLAENEIRRLCLQGDAAKAWARFLEMRTLWRAAQGRRGHRPGCDFKAFNAPYQRAFASIRNVLGPLRPAALPGRRWVDVPGASNEEGGVPLRVFTLNVLSEHLNNLFSFQFAVLQPGGGDFLSWPVRSALVVQEILRWRPQIAALQEVDDVLYHRLVQDVSCSAGLVALPFAPRNPNPRGDGVCILFDMTVLRPVPGSHMVRHLFHGHGEGQHPGGVIAAAAFDLIAEGRPVGRRLVVGTLHVNPSPSAKHALEVGVEPVNGEEFGTDAPMATQFLAVLEECVTRCGGADVQLLLGDLNGTTEPGLAALTTAGLSSAYGTAGEVAMQEWRGALVTAHNDIFHWGGELDMILFKGAEVRQVLQIPEHPRLLPGPRPREPPQMSLPMAGWPSDHMSLVSDLRIGLKP